MSFVGSLQLGPVNLFVINSALHENQRTAFLVAIGGSLPEFIYCTLAVYANHFFQKSLLFQMVFHYVFILILIGVAVVFWTKKPGVIKVQSKVANSHSDLKTIFKGFTLAFFNPQLLPFWMFVNVFFNSINFLQTKSEWHNFSFILGSGFGALTFLILLTIFVNKYKLQLLTYINSRFYFKALSFLFIAIAIQQLFLLAYNTK